jgi:hypothetical protein
MASALAPLTAGLSPQELVLLKHQNHDTLIYTCAIVFSVLTFVAVFVRVTSRHMKNVTVGIDDVLIIVALVSSPLFTTTRTIGFHAGTDVLNDSSLQHKQLSFASVSTDPQNETASATDIP